MRVLKDLQEQAYPHIVAQERVYEGTKYSIEKSRLNMVVSTLERCEANSLLDVGCGQGIYIKELQPYYKLLVGLDFCKVALVGIKKEMKNVRNVELVLCDAHKLPIRAHTFDVVLSSELLEHAQNPIEVIRQIDSTATEYILLTLPIETSESWKDTVDLACTDEGILRDQLMKTFKNTRTTHIHQFSYVFMRNILERIPDLDLIDVRSSGITFLGSGTLRKVVAKWKLLEQLWGLVETRLLSKVLIFRANYNIIGNEYCVFLLKRRNIIDGPKQRRA